MVEFKDLLSGDRVRTNTLREINEAIESEIAATVRFYTGKTDYEISKRIEDLDYEWDIERYLEANAAIFFFYRSYTWLKKERKMVYSYSSGFDLSVSACCAGMVSPCIRIQKVFYPDQKRNRS